jgi:hypothetical protein
VCVCGTSRCAPAEAARLSAARVPPFGAQIKIQEYNLEADGSKNFQSIGEARLSTWFFSLSGLFLLQLFVWLNYLRKHRADIKSIHYFMAVLVLFKAVTLFAEAYRFRSLQVLGHDDDAVIAYHVFAFVSYGMMFVVILLLGTGWSYLKPFLTDRDRYLMLALLVILVMVNIARCVCGVVGCGRAVCAKPRCVWLEISAVSPRSDM